MNAPKNPATERHGGPGASHESAKQPAPDKTGAPDEDDRRHSRVSGGGGERDTHHTRDPDTKGTTRKA